MRLFALQGQTLFAPRFRSAQPWAHAHNPAPPQGVEDAAPYNIHRKPSAMCRGKIHPSRAVSVTPNPPGHLRHPTKGVSPMPNDYENPKYTNKNEYHAGDGPFQFP